MARSWNRVRADVVGTVLDEQRIANARKGADEAACSASSPMSESSPSSSSNCETDRPD